MNELTERKHLHKDRLKENRIQHVLEVMAKYSITTDDLVQHEAMTNQEKLSRIHQIQANVRKQHESLKKAREAKREAMEAKKNGK